MFSSYTWSCLAAESKCLRRGVKEVVKSIRRGNKGLVFFFYLFAFFNKFPGQLFVAPKFHVDGAR
jgi:hypothetical protein